MASWDFIQKQILIGDANVGKSSLLIRLTDNRFLNHSEPTIGVEFGSKLVELEDKKGVVKVQIWDTAGSETFRSITRSYYRSAGGALLTFSLSSLASFKSLPSWIEDLKSYGEEDIIILIVGNKSDSLTREVSFELVDEWCKSLGLNYVETSALNGDGVVEAFNLLTREVHKIYESKLKSNNKNSSTSGSGSGGSSFPLNMKSTTSSITNGCC